MTDPGDITRLLVAYREGDGEALNRLVPLVYADLQRIARGHLRRHRRGLTLDTAGLVHEAYLRLVDQTRAHYEDRGHFLSVCARAMRQIIISNARRHAAAKRGGGDRPATLDEGRVPHPEGEHAAWLLELDLALEKLAARSQRLARAVECRFFAGLSEEETAAALGVSLRTAQRDWLRARAWLQEEFLAGRG